MADFLSFMLVAVIFGAFMALLHKWQSWSLRRGLDAVMERIRHPERGPAEVSRMPSIESRYVVRLTEESVECEEPNGGIARVLWRDLLRVDILSTSDGPFLPDVFWVLFDAESRCIVPWGAKGECELLQKLQDLPNFDNGAIVNAAGFTGDGVTNCWRKPE